LGHVELTLNEIQDSANLPHGAHSEKYDCIRFLFKPLKVVTELSVEPQQQQQQQQQQSSAQSAKSVPLSLSSAAAAIEKGVAPLVSVNGGIARNHAQRIDCIHGLVATNINGGTWLLRLFGWILVWILLLLVDQYYDWSQHNVIAI
jgi:hypothetical protein